MKTHENCVVYDPRDVYGARLEARRQAATRCARLDTLLANLRLAVFALAVGVAIAAYYRDDITVWWLMPPAATFLVLVYLHARVVKARQRADASVDYYAFALARLEGAWVGKGRQGRDYAPTDHLYANDLDIFGEGSLFELLCTARTQSGESALASWLCVGAPADVVRRRQEAVDELRHRLDLREDLSLYSGELRRSSHSGTFADWAASPALLTERWLKPAAWACSFLTVAGFVLLCTTTMLAPLLMAMILGALTGRLKGRQLAEIDEGIEAPARELRVLAQVLARLEREPMACPLLCELQYALRQDGVAASRHLHELDRLVYLYEQAGNPFFAPFAAGLMWRMHFGIALERWRARWGREVLVWLQATGELEALCALAAYAYEHPTDPFPDFADGPCFDGEALGHPLLPEQVCVRNDVRLDESQRLLVVSGSNMSGKSTLLRTVGVNAVLAQAGAPVRARRLRLSCLTVGATMRVQDSIWKGTSRFYAEITRLKQMLEATEGPFPLLFLIDEILHGTNSHDRRIGAQAVVKALVDAGAIGLITTHDLAVAQVADTFNGKAANVHFTDHFVDGHITFDYLLREGIVQDSNALRLMRAKGLPV